MSLKAQSKLKKNLKVNLVVSVTERVKKTQSELHLI